MNKDHYCHCSPPTTVLGIETIRSFIVLVRLDIYCSPPTTVLGIETHTRRYRGNRRSSRIAALPRPFSVLKRLRNDLPLATDYELQPSRDRYRY